MFRKLIASLLVSILIWGTGCSIADSTQRLVTKNLEFLPVLSFSAADIIENDKNSALFAAAAILDVVASKDEESINIMMAAMQTDRIYTASGDGMALLSLWGENSYLLVGLQPSSGDGTIMVVELENIGDEKIEYIFSEMKKDGDIDDYRQIDPSSISDMLQLILGD